MLRPKYKAFADEYLRNGGNATQAYRVAYPGRLPATARKNGCILAKNEEVKAYIQERYRTIQERSDTRLRAEMEERDMAVLLTVAEKRSILAQIARGEIDFIEQVMTKHGPETITRKPNPAERVKAIETDNKMCGDNAATNQNVNVKSEWLDWIKSGNVIEFTKQPPPPNLKIRPIE